MKDDNISRESLVIKETNLDKISPYNNILTTNFRIDSYGQKQEEINTKLTKLRDSYRPIFTPTLKNERLPEIV